MIWGKSSVVCSITRQANEYAIGTSLFVLANLPAAPRNFFLLSRPVLVLSHSLVRSLPFDLAKTFRVVPLFQFSVLLSHTINSPALTVRCIFIRAWVRTPSRKGNSP